MNLTPLNAQHLSLYLEFLNFDVNHFLGLHFSEKADIAQHLGYFHKSLRLSAKSFLVFLECCHLQERRRIGSLKMLMSKLRKSKTVIICKLYCVFLADINSGH